MLTMLVCAQLKASGEDTLRRSLTFESIMYLAPSSSLQHSSLYHGTQQLLSHIVVFPSIRVLVLNNKTPQMSLQGVTQTETMHGVDRFKA